MLGACGGVANTGFVYLAVGGLHAAHWAYRDLMRDARAYGREVTPAIIASLREPRALWCAAAAFILASTFGLLLAVHLLRSLWQLDRSPEIGRRGIDRYRRLKPYGAALTAGAWFWYGMEDHEFWVAATRHIPVGSGPPVIETTVFLLCALVPWWWIRRHAERGPVM